MATLTEEAGTQAQFVYPCDFLCPFRALFQLFCPCSNFQLLSLWERGAIPSNLPF